MITKAHITRRAAQHDVPAITVERDYVLAHVIAGVATPENDTTWPRTHTQARPRR